MKPRNVVVFATLATLLAALTILVSAGPGFAADNNVMNVNINGGPIGLVDSPYGHVTVCVPGTTNCQTIDGLLIDTGSYGLRIFSQALTVHLPVQTSGSDRIAECADFGSFTAWGRVATADVTMGGEPKILNLPVQVINANFPVAGGLPAGCNDGEQIAQSPQQLGFNGILGVGLLQYDCPTCPGKASAHGYYACTSTSCTAVKEPLDLQVQNPVALLPVDNNGVMLKLPAAPTNGAPKLTGQLFFGVNTESNNEIPAGFTIFTADSTSLNFTTVFQNVQRSGFIDSGSNGYFYDNPNLPLCPEPLSPWYCPTALTGQSATNIGADGVQGAFNFDIANAYDLAITNNLAFSDLGANVVGPDTFDWGLPFFLGRRVFVGIAGKTIPRVSESTPLWAYKPN
jgi:hypothetical protein